MNPPTEFKKPVRPLTAYHLFFQLERAAILQSIASPDGHENAELESELMAGKDIDHLMPTRYRNVKLSPTWYKSSSGKRGKTKESEAKRKHRKSHGKISFQELSQRVASKWKTLEETDNETKLYCSKIAKRELHAYKHKVKMYKANIAADQKRRGVHKSSITVGGTNSSVTESHPSSLASKTPSNSPTPSMNPNNSGMIKSPGVLSTTLGEVPRFEVSSDPNNHKLSPSQTKDNKAGKDAEFSFIPIPPSLLDREDSFLRSCKKSAPLSPELSNTLPINSLKLYDESSQFDSTMKDVDTDHTRAGESEYKDSNKGSKRHSPETSRDASPMQYGNSNIRDYNFTENDAEMLLKALF